MNIKLFAYLAISSNYMNSINGVHSSINKQPLLRCNSVPNLRQLYNSTYTATHNDISNSNSKIISSSEYKTVIYNKNKRNIYLRAKEKYTFEYNK